MPLCLCGESFGEAKHTRHHRNGCASRAGFTSPPTRTGHAFASASPRLRASACKTSRSRIDARRNGHSAGEGRSRSGIHNVKEPGRQGPPHIEQNMNIWLEKVKPPTAGMPNKARDVRTKPGTQIEHFQRVTARPPRDPRKPSRPPAVSASCGASWPASSPSSPHAAPSRPAPHRCCAPPWRWPAGRDHWRRRACACATRDRR